MIVLIKLISINRMMIERWADIPEYIGTYKVSNYGDIRNIKNNYKLKLTKGNFYLTVNLRKNGKQKSHYVHRLVLFSFVGIPDSLMQCCHNDGNGFNNRLDNLRWDSSFNNVMDRINHKSGGVGRITWNDYFILLMKELMK